MIDGKQASLLQNLIADISDDWTISFADLDMSLRYDLDLNNNIIILQSFGTNPTTALSCQKSRSQILVALIEALRMVRHVEWLEGTLSRYHPEMIILIGRVCVADSVAHVIDTAYRLKTIHNDHGPWKYILCGEWSDLARIYEMTLNRLGQNIEMNHQTVRHKAMAMIFNQWFSLQDCIRECDHDTLNIIDSIMDDSDAVGGTSLTPNSITCLTLLAGDNTSYLDKSLQKDILKNPYYRGVNDPINQAHLMQIINDMNHYRVGELMFRDKELASRFL